MLDLLKYSVKSVFANKTRSFLTISGIVVGITAMMIISIIGVAFNNTFEEVVGRLYQSDKMSVSIIPSDENHTYVKDEFGKVYPPETVFLDVREINKLLEDKSFGNSYISSGTFLTKESHALYKGRKGNTLIWAAYAGETNNASWLMLRGREVSLADNRECANTAVISDITERELFGEGGDAIGNTILIQVDNSVMPITVVGVYEDVAYSIYDASQIFINHSYIESKFSNILDDEYWQRQDLVITVDGVENKAVFKENSVAGLNKILDNSMWQVDAITETESLNAIKEIIDIILKVVLVIACISLFVGSIGIMSIMLITITERTSEIGIRKALGASGFTITFQFLCESLTLSLMGTCLGMLLGMIMTKIAAIEASSYLSRNFSMPITVNVTLPAELIAACFISAVFIGIVFGIYPALRAAKMEIVDSLRFE